MSGMLNQPTFVLSNVPQVLSARGEPTSNPAASSQPKLSALQMSQTSHMSHASQQGRGSTGMLYQTKRGSLNSTRLLKPQILHKE